MKILITILIIAVLFFAYIGSIVKPSIYKSCRKFNATVETCNCMSNTVERELGGNIVLVGVNALVEDSTNSHRAWDVARTECGATALNALDSLLELQKFLKSIK